MTMMTYKPINGWIIVSAIHRKKKDVEGFDFEANVAEEKKFRFIEMLVENVGDVKGIHSGDTVHIDKGNSFDVLMNGQTKVLVQMKNIVMINPCPHQDPEK